MPGHLTCPEIFWHVSDKRIGPISSSEFGVKSKGGVIKFLHVVHHIFRMWVEVEKILTTR